MSKTVDQTKKHRHFLSVNDRHGKKVNFFRFHSLSLVTIGILVTWIVFYKFSDPDKHAGAFFGNAIADWSGSVVIIIATKYLFEKGSEESRRVKGHEKNRVLEFLHRHSLTIFLVLTGSIWLWQYLRMDPMSKWGQVVGNIVSEWAQMIGLVLLTKRLIERGSNESH
jgi:hypothetical protein